jgi:hypothetical protein
MGVGLPVNLTPVWHHLDVCYDFATGARSVSIDGAHPVSATGVSGWPKTATIYFGAQFASNAPKEEVHVDNVLVDTTGCPR